MHILITLLLFFSLVLLLLYTYFLDNKDQLDYEHFVIDLPDWEKIQPSPKNHFMTYFVAKNEENKDTVPSVIMNNIHSYSFGENWFFSNDMCHHFMEVFNKNVFDAFRTLKPKAFQSDLWRLCILYQYGGLYTDISLKFKERIDFFSDFDVVLCEDTNKGDIYNALLYFKRPKHPFLFFCIEEMVRLIQQKQYGENPRDITGPKRLGKLFKRFYGLPLKVGQTTHKGETILILKCTHNVPNMFTIGYDTEIYFQNVKIIYRNKDYRSLKDYYSKTSKTNSYNDLWDARQVYSGSK